MKKHRKVQNNYLLPMYTLSCFFLNSTCYRVQNTKLMTYCKRVHHEKSSEERITVLFLFHFCYQLYHGTRVQDLRVKMKLRRGKEEEEEDKRNISFSQPCWRLILPVDFSLHVLNVIFVD